MRFSRFQKLAGALTMLLMLAGLAGVASHQAAADSLIREGQCDLATVVESSGRDSLRYGRRATVSYTRDGTAHSETLRYDGAQLPVNSKVPLCTSKVDPTYFATEIDGLLGTSTNLWLRTIAGYWGFGIGFAALMVLVSSHQWRFSDDEQPDS